MSLRASAAAAAAAEVLVTSPLESADGAAEAAVAAAVAAAAAAVMMVIAARAPPGARTEGCSAEPKADMVWEAAKDAGGAWRLAEGPVATWEAFGGRPRGRGAGNDAEDACPPSAPESATTYLSSSRAKFAAVCAWSACPDPSTQATAAGSAPGCRACTAVKAGAPSTAVSCARTPARRAGSGPSMPNVSWRQVDSTCREQGCNERRS